MAITVVTPGDDLAVGFKGKRMPISSRDGGKSAADKFVAINSHTAPAPDRASEKNGWDKGIKQ